MDLKERLVMTGLGVLMKMFYSLHTLWTNIMYLVWRINGTAARIDALMAGKDDGFPAQVLRIIWKLPDQFSIDPKSFFLVHEKFDSIDIVMRKRVHLLSINSKEATFIEVEESCDLFNVRTCPIMMTSQFENAKKMIILPIKAFYRLVDNLEVGDRKVVWMFHTTRCGSTAWAQAFHSLPGWTVFSEPATVRYIGAYGNYQQANFKSFAKSPEFKRYAIAIIKMYLSYAPTNSSVFWKANILDDYLIDAVVENFPHHQMIAAYRDVYPTIRSFYSTFNNLMPVQFGIQLISANPLEKSNIAINSMRISFTNGFDDKLCDKLIMKVKPRTLVDWFTFMWATKMTTIRDALQNGENIKTIKYDQLQGNRQDTIAKVFSYLGIPEENIEIACEALKDDSQKGNQMSWENRKKRKAGQWQETEAEVERCNAILKAFNLPDIYSAFDLNNSL